MMDMQKQIEEMILVVKEQIANNAVIDIDKDLISIDGNDFDHIAEQVAEAFYNAGYRKIPEGGVIEKDKAFAYMQGKISKNAVVLTREEYEKLLKEETLCERLGNDIDVKLKYIYELEDKVAQERKQTADKFAELVKMAFYYHFDELIPSIMADKIDEICKEIVEGKNE